MAILSKRLIAQVCSEYYRKFGCKAYFVNVAGRLDPAGGSGPMHSQPRRKTSYALHESINLGVPYVYTVAGSIAVWMIGLEDRNIVHGGLISGEVMLKAPTAFSRSVQGRDAIVRHLTEGGMPKGDAAEYAGALPEWSDEQVKAGADSLQDIFYMISGWKPILMKENRLKHLQKEQFNRAMDDQRRTGVQVLYNFEKERVLLANIKAGDRNEARRMLNEMLAMIYMSSQQMSVLRARTIELLSYLTRAAIEDNPMLEPLIEQNHEWINKLVKARSFEDISEVLRQSLDEFIDGIYLHGANRSNRKIMTALEFINANYGRQICLADVARQAGVSSWRFAHLVKNLTGKTFSQILQQIRIQNAQNLLARTSKTCTEVAYECGYHDQSYFIKHFRRITGTTPARYRRFGG